MYMAVKANKSRKQASVCVCVCVCARETARVPGYLSVVKDMFITSSVVIVSWVYAHVKIHQNVYVKYVQLFV